MMGPTYTINAWGKMSYVLDAALIIYLSAALYIVYPPFAEKIDIIAALIRRFI